MNSPRREIFLPPGHVCLPGEPALLCAVTASGLAVVLWDRQRRIGGMCHYARPFRDGAPATALYAYPAIAALLRMLTEIGSGPDILEASLYGGASNAEVVGHADGLAKDNLKAARDILGRAGVRILGVDAGGTWGRKIVFNTLTGECVVARVERVRASDWHI